MSKDTLDELIESALKLSDESQEELAESWEKRASTYSKQAEQYKKEGRHMMAERVERFAEVYHNGSHKLREKS